MYGIQLGRYGRIVDWGIANPYLKELMSVDPSVLSEKFFRENYKECVKTDRDGKKSIMTQFKLALPESESLNARFLEKSIN